MAEEKKVRNSKDRTERNDHSNDVQLGLLEKDGEALMKALNSAKMVAILSKNEVMYVFVFQNAYQCFIHKFDAEEGRHKAWPLNERNTAMMKNLPSMADQIFEITPKPTMDPMGVMFAAEQGIIAYLDMTGQLPAGEVDLTVGKLDQQLRNGETVGDIYHVGKALEIGEHGLDRCAAVEEYHHVVLEIVDSKLRDALFLFEILMLAKGPGYGCVHLVGKNGPASDPLDQAKLLQSAQIPPYGRNAGIAFLRKLPDGYKFFLLNDGVDLCLAFILKHGLSSPRKNKMRYTNDND